jgi:NADPH:quinone reductase-like Zn-dependent oxidoreductase
LIAKDTIMSRIVQFTRPGGPDVLEFKDIDISAPGDDEVRIRVKAIGLNRAESMWRQDAYIEPVKFPARLGYEAVGIVDAAGRNVTEVAVGDAVNTIPSFSMNQYGMYGDVVLAPSYAVVKHPPSLSFEQAASVWMMFVTAYGALIEDARLTADDAVIIPAASSSVALAAIQIGNLAGATTIALTRTSAKRQLLLDAGAKHVIASEEQDLVAEVMKITDGKGARVVFDPVGGATPLPVLDMIAKMLVIKGHNIWLTSGDPVRRKAAVEFILKGFESGALKPIIDRVFSFGQIGEAHRYMEANGQFGKIVVTV